MERLKINELYDTYQVQLKNEATVFLQKQEEEQGVKLIISLPYEGAYGMGEKFNGVNQKGKCSINQVEEKFCAQGEKTYCAAPAHIQLPSTGLVISNPQMQNLIMF